MRRQERLFLKHKRQLRCENCNRFTPVSYEMWKSFAVDDRGNAITDYIYFCRREKCIKSRAITVWNPEDAYAGNNKRHKTNFKTDSRQPTKNKTKRKKRQKQKETFATSEHEDL